MMLLDDRPDQGIMRGVEVHGGVIPKPRLRWRGDRVLRGDGTWKAWFYAPGFYAENDLARFAARNQR